MSSESSAPAATGTLFSAFVPLLPLMGLTFLGFFAPGLALPVLPRHVHDVLGQSAFVVGLVMGSQYVAAILLGRALAGSTADERGPRLAIRLGLLGVSCVGGGYFLSLALLDRPALSLGVLLASRLLTGVAEAFVITSALGWGIARLGPEHAGKVIGWVGMALFAAYGLAAPVGSAVHARFGFAGIAAATVLVPLLPMLAVAFLHAAPPSGAHRPSFWRVLGAVRGPGLALLLSSFGYATINAFLVLLFVQQGWGDAALAFTALGAGFIVARLVAGHLPDEKGGALVGGAFSAMVVLGQLLIWWAHGPVLACVGAALTGGGYALAFQGFGVEAVRRAPPQSRGAAMGGYVVFQDFAMGTAGPLGGWLALQAGLGSVYLFGALAALGAVGLAAWMQWRPAPR